MLTATVDGLKLRARRERSELTVKALVPKVAAELGKSVHPSTIEKIETGDRQPGPLLYGAICRALECEWDDLLISDEDAA
jgi:transcriptional regulator with XRE-family HTH domain